MKNLVLSAKVSSVVDFLSSHLFFLSNYSLVFYLTADEMDNSAVCDIGHSVIHF